MAQDGTAFGIPNLGDDAAPDNPWESFMEIAEDTDIDRASATAPRQAAEAGSDYPPDAEFEGEEDEPQPPLRAVPQAPAPQGEVPDEGPEEEDDSEESDEDEGDEDDEEQLYAGRYPTMEAFQQGYTEIQRAFTESVRDRQALQGQLQQQAQQIDYLQELIQATISEVNPEVGAQLQARNQMEQQVAQIAEQRLGPVADQLRQQQATMQLQAAVGEFYRRHPEVTPRGPADVQIGQTVGYLRNMGAPIDPTNVDHLDLAYAMTRDPQTFQRVLFAGPGAWSPGGAANLMEPGTSQANGERKPRAKTARRRVEAHVETGGSGAPVPSAPGSKPPKDEFDEAMRAHKAMQSGRSVLFGRG